MDSPAGTLKTGVRPRTFKNRNRLVRNYGFVNGVKTGHTRGAGYVLVGSASKNGIQLVSAVLATPSENARDQDTMALFNWAIPRFQRIRAVIKGREMATAQIRYRAGAELKLVPTRTIRRIVLRGHRDAVKVDVHAPSVVEGPIRSGQRLGRVEVSQGGKVVATVPLIAQGSVPATSVAQRTKSAAGTPWILLGVALAALGATVLLARRRAQTSRRPSPGGPAPHDRHRHAQHGHRQDAVGAQLQARPPPPHRRADDDAGRQGRQRRARAQDARRARDRHRAWRAARPARASSTSSRSSPC